MGTLAERLDRVEKTVDSFEGTVARACQQTDAITSTLHQELKAKQALVSELQDAYEDFGKAREMSISRLSETSSGGGFGTGGGVRPSSRSRNDTPRAYQSSSGLASPGVPTIPTSTSQHTSPRKPL